MRQFKVTLALLGAICSGILAPTWAQNLKYGDPVVLTNNLNSTWTGFLTYGQEDGMDIQQNSMGLSTSTQSAIAVVTRGQPINPQRYIWYIVGANNQPIGTEVKMGDVVRLHNTKQEYLNPNYNRSKPCTVDGYRLNVSPKGASDRVVITSTNNAIPLGTPVPNGAAINLAVVMSWLNGDLYNSTNMKMVSCEAIGWPNETYCIGLFPNWGPDPRAEWRINLSNSQGAPIPGSGLPAGSASQPVAQPVDINAIDPGTQQAKIHALSQSGDIESVKALVKSQNANVNLKEGSQGQTPLHIAVSRSNLPLVQALVLDCAADVNLRDNAGKVPLDLALENANMEAANFLLNNNANASMVTTGMDRMIQSNNNAMVGKLLLKGASPDKPIAAAIAKDNVELLQTVVNNTTVRMNNANFNSAIDARSPQCAKTILNNGSINMDQAMDYVLEKKDKNFIRIVLDKGVDVTTVNKVLGYSIGQRDVEFSRELITTYHADPNTGMGTAVATNQIDMVKLLLDNGADPNQQMAVAAGEGKIDIVREFLAYRGDPSKGVEPAAKNDKIPTLQLLLDNDGDANIAMPIAIDKGNLTMVNMCLSARKPANVYNAEYVKKTCEKSNYDILNALLMAQADPNPGMPISVGKGDARLVDLMIKANANVNKPEYMVTACTRNDAPVCKLLLDARADPNPGMMPAVSGGFVGIVTMLLQSGADATPAQYIEKASEQGNDAIVQALIGKGASPDAGMNAAVRNNHASTTQLLISKGADGTKESHMRMAAPHNNPDLVAVLISAGGPAAAAMDPAMDNNADKVVRLIAQKGVTVTSIQNLEKCVKKDFTATATVLVDLGAKGGDYWDAGKGMGLLHIAISDHISQGMVPVLIRSGCDVNKPDSRGNSPLMLAVMSAVKNKARDPDVASIINTLIRSNADVNAQNSEGETVLKVCPNRGSLQKILKDAGAVNKIK